MMGLNIYSLVFSNNMSGTAVEVVTNMPVKHHTAALCGIMPCCAVLCRAVLCCAVLCCAVLPG